MDRQPLLSEFPSSPILRSTPVYEYSTTITLLGTLELSVILVDYKWAKDKTSSKVLKYIKYKTSSNDQNACR